MRLKHRQSCDSSFLEFGSTLFCPSMGLGLRYLRGNHRLRFHFSFAFLIWSLIPHYGFLVHRHQAGEGGHFHRTFSRTEITAAKRVLESLQGSALPESELAADETRPVHSHSVQVGDRTLRDQASQGERHGHTWSDPNQVSVSSHPFWRALAALPLPPQCRPYLAPDLISGLSHLARGPPAALLT